MLKNLNKSILNNLNYVGKVVDFYIEKSIKKGDVVVDTTIGNGNDTLKLAEAVGTSGVVYGFDIQKKAINKTLEKLRKNNVDLRNILLYNDSHSNIDKYIQTKINFAIMNLGYLPGSDKSITTTCETTIMCIDKTKHMLKQNSKMLIMLYPGHTEGSKEKIEILSFLKSLNQNEYNIVHINMVNQINHPPELIILEKRN